LAAHGPAVARPTGPAGRTAAEAALLKAMAHPARMRILRELAYAERCVGDLTAATGGSISSVSRHLAQLHAVGIVRTRKRGTHVFYAWSTPCVGKILECVRHMLRRTVRTVAHGGTQRNDKERVR